MRDLRTALPAGGALVLLAACSSISAREFQEPWSRADFPAAEDAADRLIAQESGVEAVVVAESHGLAPEIDAEDGETYLYMLEKGMCRLAFADLDSAIDLWRRSRDVLDEKLASTDLAGYFSAVLTDDRSTDYVGADYEHVLVRTMIALSDLLNGAPDALAYAFQISAKQEEIASLDFGDQYDEEGEYVGYNPREEYRRVPIGKYLEGVVLESERSFDEAAKAYRSAAEMAGGSELARRGILRCEGELRGGEGTGSVHVFYLVGMAPELFETTSPVTDLALSLAQIGAILGDVDVGVIAQAPVPVPGIRPRTGPVAPLEVRAGGDVATTTERIMDVDATAARQLEARMPWILARAALRRAVKATASKKATDRVGDTGLALFLNLLANLIWTGVERADLRHWSSLPSEFHAAHLYLPEGVHELDLGPAMRVPVEVRRGYASFVVVLRPDLSLPGAVLVDTYSRVSDPYGTRFEDHHFERSVLQPRRAADTWK